MNEMSKTPATRTSIADISPFGWLRGEIDRMFADVDQPGRGFFDIAKRVVAPMPPLELNDTGDAYRLTAELPGLTDKDVSVEVTEGVLVIAGEKTASEERKDEGRLISERRYGAFRREIALPADADPNEIKAKFNHGVLSLEIAKDRNAPQRSRKIAIEA
ncbi:Hsp20/alpha crystallin family protein [Sphingomonas sp. H39-1-10]|uniref:Hsp20/alpha crystallin family protein n=1 Tax=Sphingomonas TaxID=13687 RepID=UPI0008800C6E|nr:MULTISPECIES: Hsp20/alpha crystallin family protein [Sphingomonas]MDF0487534.1 Hsp20/alpha crystallin family protein [Sphingomonas pollutisoli]SDA16487.1 HSP20 family protein [Sphingomonas sp. NFR15]